MVVGFYILRPEFLVVLLHNFIKPVSEKSKGQDFRVDMFEHSYGRALEILFPGLVFLF